MRECDLDSQQCVDAVGEEQFDAFRWFPGDPQVKEANTKITLITEDRLLHTHRNKDTENNHRNIKTCSKNEFNASGSNYCDR